jgi:hypothetical protein
MLNMPSFVKIGSGIQKLVGGIHRDSMEMAWGHFRKAGS